MTIIGLVGFIGSGKGTVGEILESKGFKRDSFAAPLKDAVSTIFGWNRALLEGDTKDSREWREKNDPFWSEKFGKPFSPRMALQLMGTEAGREIFHRDIWVISLFHRSQGKNIVVTDVRFKNEIDFIQRNGGFVVRVKRGNDPNWYDIAARANAGEEQALMAMEMSEIHRSEWDWCGSKFDYEICNDDTIESLKSKVEDMLTIISNNDKIVFYMKGRK